MDLSKLKGICNQAYLLGGSALAVLVTFKVDEFREKLKGVISENDLKVDEDGCLNIVGIKITFVDVDGDSILIESEEEEKITVNSELAEAIHFGSQENDGNGIVDQIEEKDGEGSSRPPTDEERAVFANAVYPMTPDEAFEKIEVTTSTSGGDSVDLSTVTMTESHMPQEGVTSGTGVLDEIGDTPTIKDGDLLSSEDLKDSLGIGSMAPEKAKTSKKYKK